MAAVGRDQTMGEPARHIAALSRNAGQPAWFYRFSYVAESARAQSPGGAAHASEIPFFFNTVAAKYGDKLTPQDAAAGTAVQSYIANFARTLDPNGRGLPAWPVYDPATRPVMDFGADGAPRGGADPLRPQLDLVEQLSSRAP
jgi:para-nitrobenzyl esterase